MDYKSEKAVGVFNKVDKKEVIELFGSMVQNINTTNIAKVCFTDSQTVDLMLGEFTAQMAHAAKSNCSVRVNFKVGHLLIRNNVVQFQQSTAFRLNNGSSPESLSINTLSEFKGDLISVMTPSVACPSNGRSSVKSVNHHASNPNPQPDQHRHLSMREMANEYANATPGQRKTMDMLKFGKRVVFDRRLSNTDMLNEHLAAMREQISGEKNGRENRINEEKETLSKIRKYMEDQDQLKNRQQEAMRYAFDRTNELQKEHLQAKR